MEETINVQEVLSILKKRGWLIVGGILLGFFVAALVTFFWITPQYRARVQLLVTTAEEPHETAQLNDLNANILLIHTYQDVIRSDVVLDKVEQQLKKKKVPISEVALRQNLEVEQSPNSQMFEIRVINAKAEEAAVIANTVAQVFQNELKSLRAGDQVTILSTAKPDHLPVSPNKPLNLFIGSVIGCLLGIGCAIWVEWIDPSVKSSAFVTETLEFPVLGTISQMSPNMLKKIRAKEAEAEAIIKKVKGDTILNSEEEGEE